ncbi:MAG: acylphosphatase [Candidatus Marinimicrobia bacterium]|nr:acylphosphatase [Candidatus Neomarinimicrobiota bacterium]
MQIHAEIVINGMVQGVGFRYFTQRLARQFNLPGYVKNMPNGNVLCEVEGDEDIVRDFIKDLKIGPSFSYVSGVDINTSPDLFGYTSFEVRF